jgi:membrane protein
MLVLMTIQAIFPERSEYTVTLLTDLFPELFLRLPEDFWDSFLSADVPLISLTVVGMLWSASKGVKSLRAGLCSVYGEVDREGLLKRYIVSFFHTVLFVFFTAAMLIVTVWGGVLYSYIEKNGIWVYGIIKFILNGRTVIMPVAVSFIVAFIYKLLAAKTEKLASLFPGAVFSGMAWMIYSKLFSLYIRYFSKYNILYGSIGLIPVIMLWIYSCMVILLLGAEFNVYIKRRPLIK